MRTARIKGGYGTIQRVVMKCDISQQAKLVYCLFASYAGEDKECWPSISTICKDLKMGRGTVVKAIGELESHGFLEKEIRYNSNGSKTSNKYYLMVVVMEGSSQPEPPPVPRQNHPSSGVEPPPVLVENYNNNNKKRNIEETVNPDGLTGSSPIHQEHEIKKSPPIAAHPPRKSTYQELVDLHWEWFKNRNGVVPKMDGIEGKATKQLVTYLESVARHKAGEEVLLPQDLQLQVCEMFEYILNKWNQLEPFMQRQVKLSQINSNITNIINYLKHGSKTQSAHQRKQDRQSVIDEGLEIIRGHFGKQGRN